MVLGTGLKTSKPFKRVADTQKREEKDNSFRLLWNSITFTRERTSCQQPQSLLWNVTLVLRSLDTNDWTVWLHNQPVGWLFSGLGLDQTQAPLGQYCCSRPEGGPPTFIFIVIGMLSHFFAHLKQRLCSNANRNVRMKDFVAFVGLFKKKYIYIYSEYTKH